MFFFLNLDSSFILGRTVQKSTCKFPAAAENFLLSICLFDLKKNSSNSEFVVLMTGRSYISACPGKCGYMPVSCVISMTLSQSQKCSGLHNLSDLFIYS